MEMDEALPDERYRHSKPCQTSKMGFFAKIVNGFLFSQKSSVLDVCQGSEYVSAEK